MCEYNVVVGLFKLQLANYLHGDLRRRIILKTLFALNTEFTIKGSTIYLFSGSLCHGVSPAYPSASANYKLAKEIVLYIFAEGHLLVITHLKPIKFLFVCDSDRDIVMTI